MAARPDILIAAAAPSECRAIAAGFGAEPPPTGRLATLGEGVALLALGVGPMSAAESAGRCLAGGPWGSVLNLGIGGAYDTAGLDVLGVLLGDRTVPGDFGLTLHNELRSLETMGFGPMPDDSWQRCEPALVARLAPLADAIGPIATVASASGADERARAVQARTGALGEAMEGAAVNLACRRAGRGFVELRVISNLVGDRAAKPWRLAESLEQVGLIAHEAAALLRG
jgi:futalosine hydrolase